MDRDRQIGAGGGMSLHTQHSRGIFQKQEGGLERCALQKLGF